MTVAVLDRTVPESIFPAVGYSCAAGGLYKGSYVTELPLVGKTFGRETIACAAILPEYKHVLFFVHFPH